MTKTKLKVLIVIIILISFVIVVKNKKIENYPQNTIDVIVAYKEGGGTDIGTRLLLKEIQKYFPISFSIKNIPGKNGEIGYSTILGAKPDGYTIGVINFPNFLSLSLQKKNEYSKDDMEIIVNYIYDSGVLIVNLNSKWKNLEEFILEAKKNPRKITLGNNGIGMSNHLGGIMLENEAGIEFIHTPFSSSSDILEALEKDYIDAAIVKISEVGDVDRKFQILASFTEERLEIIEDIPTLKEKGYDVIFGSTRAFVVPKGTPRQILEKLREIFKKGIRSYENIENFKKIGLNIKYIEADEMKSCIEEEEKN